MKKFIVFIIMFVCVLLLFGQVISDKFDNDLSKWSPDVQSGANDIIDYQTNNDSLKVSLHHDKSSEVTLLHLITRDLSEYSDLNEYVEFDVSFHNDVNIEYAYEDGVRGFELIIGDDVVRIVQSYCNVWGESNTPGYYIITSNLGVIQYIPNTGQLDFTIQLMRNKDDPFIYNATIKWYENGYYIDENNNGWFVGMDFTNTSLSTGVLNFNYQNFPSNIRDEDIDLSISTDRFYVYPDYSEARVEKTAEIYGYKDETIIYHAEDSYTGYPITQREVTIETGDNQQLLGQTDENGNAEFAIYTVSDDPIDIAMPGAFYDYSGTVNVRINEMDVAHIDEVYIPQEKTLEITVRQEPVLPGSELLPPLADAEVTVSNGDNIEYSGLTNSLGKFTISDYIDYSGDINVKVEKETYRTYEGIVRPVIHTNTPEALGKNNQINIIHTPNTDNAVMLYSNGDTLLYGTTDNFGESWHVNYLTYDHDDNISTPEILAIGINPVLTRTANGYVAVWNDELYLVYTIKESPWTPIDTINNMSTIWHSEGVLSASSDGTMKYGSYISNSNLNEERGDLIFTQWQYNENPGFIEEEVLASDGSAGATPQCSPLVAGYIDFPNESYLAGCIDMDNRVAYSRWLLEDMEWENAYFADNAGQYCLNPSIDFNGYNTTFVWEVDNGDNTKDIWERKITPYGIEEAKKVNVTDGINRYAKNRDNELYTYVNNDMTLIDYRDGYSDPLNPITYTLYEGNDSLHSYSVDVRPVKMNTEALYAITEGSNGNYRINFINKTYENWMPRSLTAVPTDTIIIDAHQSPISNYVNGSFPVERMSVDIPIVDNGMANMIELTTDDKNPHIPQVIMIDGEVMGVIYGGNEVKETDIEIPSYMRDDNMITVTVDRMKGNPNRTIQIALYEYETEQAQTVSNNQIAFKTQTSNNDLQTSMSINRTLSTINLKYSIPQSGYVNLRIFDAAGRVIETVRSGSVNQGNYTYTPKATKSGVYFAVMEYEGNVYKEKFIILK